LDVKKYHLLNIVILSVCLSEFVTCCGHVSHQVGRLSFFLSKYRMTQSSCWRVMV